jgi:hypothetical protein
MSVERLRFLYDFRSARSSARPDPRSGPSCSPGDRTPPAPEAVLLVDEPEPVVAHGDDQPLLPLLGEHDDDSAVAWF